MGPNYPATATWPKRTTTTAPVTDEAYQILVQKILAIQAAWAAAGRYPDTNTDRAAIEQAIDAAVAAINMEMS